MDYAEATAFNDTQRALGKKKNGLRSRISNLASKISGAKQAWDVGQEQRAERRHQANLKELKRLKVEKSRASTEYQISRTRDKISKLRSHSGSNIMGSLGDIGLKASTWDPFSFNPEPRKRSKPRRKTRRRKR
jgi:chromosome segregation ATPase